MLPLIKIDTLEEERIIYSIITKDILKKTKEIVFKAIEEFVERRSI